MRLVFHIPAIDGSQFPPDWPQPPSPAVMMAVQVVRWSGTVNQTVNDIHADALHETEVLHLDPVRFPR